MSRYEHAKIAKFIFLTIFANFVIAPSKEQDKLIGCGNTLIFSEQVVITCTQNFVKVNGHCVEKSSISREPTPHPSILLNQLL